MARTKEQEQKLQEANFGVDLKAIPARRSEGWLSRKGSEIGAKWGFRVAAGGAVALATLATILSVGGASVPAWLVAKWAFLKALGVGVMAGGATAAGASLLGGIPSTVRTRPA